MTTAKSSMKNYYRDLFDSIPSYWDDIYGADSFYGNHYRQRRDRIETLLRTQSYSKSARILDVGCGAGGYFPVYLDMGLSIVGMDVAQGMVDRAAAIYADQVREGIVEVCTGDIEGLIWDDNSFDVVNCAGVLMYLPDPDAALREMYRVLKPGGVATLNTDNHRTVSAVFDLPTMWRSVARKLRRARMAQSAARSEPESAQDGATEPPTKTYPPAEFRRRVTEAGFEILDESGHGFDRIRWNGRQAFPDNWNTRIYNALDPLYRIRAVGRTGMTYTVLGRKKS